MRAWMNLFESDGNVVYHGGPGLITTDLRIPFFVTPNREMARSYADTKGGGAGVISAFEFHPQRIANAARAIEVSYGAIKYRIDQQKPGHRFLCSPDKCPI